MVSWKLSVARLVEVVVCILELPHLPPRTGSSLPGSPDCRTSSPSSPVIPCLDSVYGMGAPIYTGEIASLYTHCVLHPFTGCQTCTPIVYHTLLGVSPSPFTVWVGRGKPPAQVRGSTSSDDGPQSDLQNRFRAE